MPSLKGKNSFRYPAASYFANEQLDAARLWPNGASRVTDTLTARGLRTRGADCGAGRCCPIGFQIAPQLAMPMPKSEIPADSHFIRFRPALLPDHMSLWHKVGYGHVGLQFSGMGENLAEMEKLYRSSLMPSMR